jgi:NAD(P)-dependent dehydrogenase (short-subunit alcohol dehydrogenase family)
MQKRDRLLLGAAVGAGALWGARALRRWQRRIDLDGRVVLITGASSGHGLLLARHAAERGARLVLAARGANELQAAAAELDGRGAPGVLTVPTDVTDAGQVQTLVDRAIDRFGQVDVLVNNAGIISVGPLHTMTVNDFRDALATNFWGAVYATLAVLPHMRARRFGRIGNVVSIGGLVGVPHLAPYTASKFALTGFTRALRAELAGDNILVTGVYPHTMRTGGHTHAWIKGEPAREYAWFALSDTVPGLSVSADRVARTFWRAVCDGEAEVVAGWPARCAATLQALLPNETAEVLALVAQTLPDGAGAGTAAVRGEDLLGPIPELFNRAIPPGTRPRVR